MLDKNTKYLIIVAVIICIAIACLAPFLASSNPDGLEKSVEDANVSEDAAKPVINSPLPDYTFEPLGKLGEIGALIVGIVIVLVVALGISYVIKKK